MHFESGVAGGDEFFDLRTVRRLELVAVRAAVVEVGDDARGNVVGIGSVAIGVPSAGTAPVRTASTSPSSVPVKRMPSEAMLTGPGPTGRVASQMPPAMPPSRATMPRVTPTRIRMRLRVCALRRASRSRRAQFARLFPTLPSLVRRS